MLLVKFFAVDCKIESIDQFQYISNISTILALSGFTTEYPSNQTNANFMINSAITPLDDGIFLFEYIYRNAIFQIIYEFGTYSTSKQLEIQISSDDYIIKPENNYLEQLKLKIKMIIKHDWEKLIWLYDKDSEALSVALYPNIYRTENMMRQFISEVMNKEYGAKWWDLFVPIVIKAKHRARAVGYKTVVPGFNNIDERLLSIDVGDLLDILQMQLKKWNPRFDTEINDMLVGKKPTNNVLMEKLLDKQTTIVTDLWKEQFSQYLPEEFLKEAHIFELNRNHVVHNKLIDRIAYNSILLSIEVVDIALNKALSFLSIMIRSKEQIDSLEREFLLQEEEERKSTYKEIIESEANIKIRDFDEILNLFNDMLSDLHTHIIEDLRFRSDLNISDYQDIDSDSNEGQLFDIEYKITGTIARIYFGLNIDDSPGSSSQVKISLSDGEHTIVENLYYTNGEAVFDTELGYYMPECYDEISDTDELRDSIIAYVNEHYESLPEKVDADMYFIIKDGGNNPIADIPCCECGNDYICIDENYAPFGKCLSCGTQNEIRICERCSCYFEQEDDGELGICPNCFDLIKFE
ncbi:hypothetical protein [Acetobacterium bakii]|uniref:Uncharacterized protein n=1 Tax=Acetobacterium bakii TaxID=52689 RepID=A0A0L6TZI4_9FIRM|nr:hypothetical protein [Acetobacterium bakii]KNZ41681.1 hypothetical protein AKG39_10860 [Acetobacterium bakii]